MPSTYSMTMNSEPPSFVKVVDVDDVLVLQRRDRQRLALEANRELRVLRDRGLERLDGDRAVEALLDGLVDDGHAARADLLDDAAVADAIDHPAHCEPALIMRAKRPDGQTLGRLASSTVQPLPEVAA